MQIPSRFLEKAAEQISTLPGIGKRTALKLALHIHRKNDESFHAMIESLVALKMNSFSCSQCGNIADDPTCSICGNPSRDQGILCVVEDIRDIMAIEATSSYKGLYHVLGGIISPMDGIGPSDLSIDLLQQRAMNAEIREVIFALSPTLEGDTTNFFIYKKINREGLLLTTLSRGVAIGSELQYADEITLSKSLQQRQEFKLSS
ncbi:MAG: recombination mediator RecR [Flavobacteriales bacterium]